MHKFRPGIERILAATPVPVIPMALNGLWGSVFSRHPSHMMRKILQGIRSRVELNVAPMLAAEAVSAPLLQKQVEQMVTG
jgi:1-acyl-sn-glycerol-3-phosphate acyltransferase